MQNNSKGEMMREAEKRAEMGHDKVQDKLKQKTASKAGGFEWSNRDQMTLWPSG